MSVVAGDFVLFAAAAGEAVRVEGHEYLVLREADVLGVFVTEGADVERGPWAGRPGVAGATPRAAGAPLLDVLETPERFEILIDLPGIAASTLKVVITGRTLTVTAVRRPRADVPSAAYRLRERAWGSLERTVELGSAVIAAQARATYEAGVLAIRVPKAEAARSRSIPIGTA